MTENKNAREQKNQKTMSDEAIIELYWGRDESAITETDKKYGKYLFTIACNIVHDRLDCEECLNDTYLGTWNRIPPTRPAVFNVFLSKIIRNIAIDKVRKETAGKRVPSELITSMEELDECMLSDTSVEEELFIRQISRALNTFLRTLSDREEFVLSYQPPAVLVAPKSFSYAKKKYLL